MAIIVPKRKVWTGQPPNVFQLNYRNPLTQSIVNAGIPSGLIVPSLNGVTPTLSGSVTYGSDAYGQAVKTTASAAQGLTYPGSWSRLSASKGYSLLTVFKITSAANLARISGNFLSVNYGYELTPDSGFLRFAVSSGTPTTIIGNPIVNGNVVSAIGTVGSTNISLYENGKRTAGPTAHAGVTTPPGDFKVFSDNGGTNGSIIGSVYLWILFNRELTPIEAASLSANPWQLFAPTETSVYFPFMGIRSPNISYERKVWTRQPSNQLQVLPQYAPYFNSLNVYNGSPNYEPNPLLNRTDNFTQVGSVSTVNTLNGVGTKGDGTTGYLTRTLSPGITPKPGFIFASFVADSTTSGTAYSLGSSAASFGAYFSVQISAGYLVSSQMRWQDGSGILDMLNKQAIPINGVISVVFVIPDGSMATAYMYINGTKYTGATNNNLTASTANAYVYENINALKRSTVSSFGNATVLATGYGFKSIPEGIVQKISQNPWQIFAPNRQLLYNNPTLFYTRQLPNYSVNVLQNDSNKNYQLPATNLNVGNVVQNVQLTYLQPNSDKIIGNWAASTGNTLYGVLRDSSAGDSDYIQSTSATSCEIKLETGSTPISKDNHSLKYRLLSGSGNLEVSLRQGYPNLYVPERKVWSIQPESVSSASNPSVFLYNTTSDATRTYIGTVTKTYLSSGIAETCSGTGNRIDFSRNISPVSPTQAFFVINFKVNSLASTARLIVTHSSTNYAGLDVQITAAGAIYVNYGDNVGSGSANRRSLSSGAGIVSTNREYTLTIGYTSSTTGICFLNGTSIALTASGTAATYSVGSGVGMLHSLFNSGSYIYGNQTINLAALFYRQINAIEAKSLSENPWQLFAPRRQYFPLNQSTPIKTWNHILTDSTQVISQTLTSAEANTITNYSDLRVGLTSS